MFEYIFSYSFLRRNFPKLFGHLCIYARSAYIPFSQNCILYSAISIKLHTNNCWTLIHIWEHRECLSKKCLYLVKINQTSFHSQSLFCTTANARKLHIDNTTTIFAYLSNIYTIWHALVHKSDDISRQIKKNLWKRNLILLNISFCQ